jgi:hypothetical protein
MLANPAFIRLVQADFKTFFETKHLIFIIFFKNYSYVYNYLKTIIFSLIVSILFFLYALYFFHITIVRQAAVWFVILAIVFWLLSGFNYFLKKYKFGKFTSAIQRF